MDCNYQIGDINFKLSPEQQRFMEDPLINDICLIACPGAGKSTSILLKIDQMSKLKQIKGKSCCLILTFSKQQCEDLKLKTQQYGLQGIGINNIMTIHSLCGKIYNAFTDRSSSSKKTIVVAVNKLLGCQEDVLKQVPCLKNIKYIFVDEAQDLSEEQYNTIMLISKQLKDSTVPVIMIGDANQNIYQFQGSMNKFLLNHSIAQLNLSINNRSTDQIVDFIRGFQVHPAPMQGYGKQGVKPFIFLGSCSDIYVDLIKEIRTLCSQGIQFEQIAIIGPSKMQKQYGKNVSNIGLQSICNLLEENEIPYQQRYQLSNGNEESACSELVKGRVNILTVHGSKGLEFEAVIIVDFKLKSMNKTPTIDQFEAYKYLWFVALSRAKQYLRIYNLNKEQIWPQIHNINPNLFDSNQSIILQKKQRFAVESPLKSISVTQMLADNLMFSSANVFMFSQLIDLQVKETQIYNPPNINMDLDPALSTLYGLFMENVIEFCQHIHNNTLNQYIYTLERRFQSYITIKNEMFGIFTEIDRKYNLKGATHTNQILNQILEDSQFKQGSKEQVQNFVELIRQGQKNNTGTFKTVFMSPNAEINSNTFGNLIKVFQDGISSKQEYKMFTALFQIILYFFQIDNQAAYLLKRDFTCNIDTLFAYFPLIAEYVQQLGASGNSFQQYVEHPDINIHGIADLITEERIVEFKFASEYSIMHALQVYFYQLCSQQTKKTLQVFNIRTGIEYTLIPSSSVQEIKVLLKTAEITGIKLRNRVFIYDLETQGLDRYNDQIIQRHVVDYSTRSVVSTGFLNFPISDYIRELTHITEEQLKSGDQDYSRMKEEFKQISKCCENPVLIAHNGTSFDHLFLQQKGLISYSDFLLSDSKAIIAQHYHKKGNLQISLSQLYQLICGQSQQIQQVHNAIYDVQMLLEIFDTLKITTKDLLVRE